MYVTDIQLPSPEGRGDAAFSSREVVARMIAPLDRDPAASYSDSSDYYEGTALWRTAWWLEIWNSVNETRTRALLGHAYGYDIGQLSPYLDGDFIRTPHDVFFYVLAYTGWIGVTLFLFFQIEIVRLLAKAWRQTGQPFGLVFWLALMGYALFTPFFETPQGAILFSIIVGWMLAPAVRRVQLPVPAARESIRYSPMPQSAARTTRNQRRQEAAEEILNAQKR